MAGGVSFELPPNWTVANLSLFFEGEKQPIGQRPFAGSILCQLRMDVPPGASLSSVRARDMLVAEEQIEGVHIISHGPTEVGGTQGDHIEWMYPDPTVETIHQLIVYAAVEGRVYTVTGTHRGDHFAKIREDVLAVAASIGSQLGK